MPLDRKHLVRVVNGALADTDLDAVFAAIRPAKNVVIHLHGGLIHEGVAERSAAELVDDYVEDGRALPVFWLWNSGFLQIQKECADFLNDPKTRKMIRRLLEWSGALDPHLHAGSPVAAALPTTLSAMLAENALLAGLQLGALLPRVLDRVGERRLRMIVVEEVLRGTNLGERMQRTWQDMKGVIDRAFDPTVANAAGSAFIAGLKAVWTDERRFTIVGHSAGAIYALRLLKAADAVLPASARFDLVFLAPACTFAEMFALRDVLCRRVRSLRMFALTDARESAIYELNKVYPGSILYLVSGLLEESVDMPLVGMERYHVRASDAPDIVGVRQAFANATVWAPSDVGPLPSDAVTHTQFDDADRSTMSSVYKLLSGAVTATPFEMP